MEKVQKHILQKGNISKHLHSTILLYIMLSLLIRKIS